MFLNVFPACGLPLALCLYLMDDQCPGTSVLLGSQPDLEAFRCHIYSVPCNSFFASVLILYHQSVNNGCMFSFISGNIWNSHAYLVVFCWKDLFLNLVSYVIFLLSYTLLSYLFSLLYMLGHEFVNPWIWILILPSNNVYELLLIDAAF